MFSCSNKSPFFSSLELQQNVGTTCWTNIIRKLISFFFFFSLFAHNASVILAAWVNPSCDHGRGFFGGRSRWVCFLWWGEFTQGNTGDTSRGLGVSCGSAFLLLLLLLLPQGELGFHPRCRGSFGFGVRCSSNVSSGKWESPSLPQCWWAVCQSSKLTWFGFQSYLLNKVHLTLQAEICLYVETSQVYVWLYSPLHLEMLPIFSLNSSFKLLLFLHLQKNRWRIYIKA